MNFLTSLSTALGNLRANKMRSLLTMLGVIIGVSSVIVMITIVEGARYRVVQEFERLGSSLILVVYAPNQDDQKKDPRRIEGMTMQDVAAIQQECDQVASISAELPAPNDFTAKYRDRESQAKANGVQPDYSFLRNVTVKEGRFLTDDDVGSWEKVCVLGAKTKQELFGKENPVGQDIEIENVSLTVVGTLEPKGRTGDQDPDHTIFLPITTIQKRFIGRDIVGIIWAQPVSSTSLEPAMDQIWEILMRRYKNLPGFRVDSQDNMLKSIGRILTIFGLIAGGVAGLALLVGGIGIMNIMLVSVTERTREIGIRKAVGAKRRDILIQFLIESATVSGTGGLLGIGVGAGISYLVGAVSRKLMSAGSNGEPAGIPIHLPMWAVLGAFLFSAFVGVFFGIVPAMRAARLDPIEALRYE